MAKWILLFSVLIGAVLCQDTYICESEKDCICNECNRCLCTEAGSPPAGCTEMGCGACYKWEAVKNESAGTCGCECTSRPSMEDVCMEGDCKCDTCNVCHCAGVGASWGQGTWACTEMACMASSSSDNHAHDDDASDDVSVSQYCEWKTRKTYDSYGKAQCQCECVPYHSGAVAVQASLLSVILTVVGRYL